MNMIILYLDGNRPAVFDLSGENEKPFAIPKRNVFTSGVIFSTSANFTDRSCYETQNCSVSSVEPGAPIVARIHGTPGYPLAVVAGMTFRLGAK